MYRSGASVGAARIAPDIIVRMPSRALRVLRIVLSVGIQSARVWLKVSQIERGHAVIPLEGSLSVFVGRHGAMNLAGRVRRNMWTKIKLGTATYYQKLAFFLLRVVSVMTFWGGGGCVVASLGPPPFDGLGRLRDPRRRSKPLSAWSPRGHQAVTSGSIMPTEQLTFDLKEIRHTPLPARSPRGHRSDFEHERERADQLVTAQDRMVAELEALHSLLEAAQQAAPPLTSRPPDMARHDMARDDSLAQSMRSLLEAAQAARLEAAQQAAPPVTSRTWREMTWSERWRWLRRSG